MLAIEHSPRNFAFGLVLSPSLVFSGLKPLYFFFFYQLLLLLSFLLQPATTPSPAQNIQFISPMCLSSLLFHNNIYK